MSEHNLILEFYKPTYNLDFDYDGDGGLDLHFTNIKGEFFMTMNDSYNSVYIEDEDCEFSKGEMFATVDLGDLVERIINGEFRQTNGKAVSYWGKRFIGDDEEQIEFNGKNYADGSFCEYYLYLPNIEVDTVSNKWDFENGKVELKSNDKWGIGISDDYNIISVDEFTCDSVDAFVAYDVASSEADEDDYYESKKYARKSLKEEYDPTDDIINKGNSVGMDYETFLNFAEKQDYRFNVTDATFHFAINNNIKIDGRECSCIPSEDGILIIDNHSSIEIPRKDIDIVEGVSLNSKNVLRMDVFTKDGHVLTVWWSL